MYCKEVMIETISINHLPHPMVSSSTKMGTEFSSSIYAQQTPHPKKLGICECFMIDTDEWKILKGNRKIEQVCWLLPWKRVAVEENSDSFTIRPNLEIQQSHHLPLLPYIPSFPSLTHSDTPHPHTQLFLREDMKFRGYS